MTSRTAMIIAAVGVFLSLCVGLFGGAVAGFYFSQFATRGATSALPFLDESPQSQLTPNAPGPFFRGPGRFGQGRNIQGAAVTQVVTGSPADKAGLQQGDVITAVDGQKVNSANPLNQYIQAKKPGDTLDLTVQRGPNSQTLKVVLGTSPSDSTVPYLGIRFTMLDSQATPVPGAAN